MQRIKYILFALWFCVFYSNYAQNQDKLNAIEEILEISEDSAVKQLQKIKFNSLSLNEKAQYTWIIYKASFKKDSLIHFINTSLNASISIANKAKLLALKSNYYTTYNWNFVKAKPYIEEAYSILEKNKKKFSTQEETYITLQYAISLFAYGNYNKAYDIANTCTENLLELPCSQWTLKLLNDFILTQAASNQPHIIEKYATKVLQCSKEEPLKNYNFGVLYNNLGQAEIVNTNYYQALQHLLKAKNYFLKQEFPYEWYWHMGWLHTETGNFLLANQYLEKTENLIVKNIGEETHDFFIINQLQLLNALNQNDTIAAKAIIRNEKKLAEKLKLNNDLLSQFNDLQGRYYTLISDYDSALYYYQKAFNARIKEAGDKHFDILSSYRNLIETNYKNKNYKAVKSLLRKSEKIIRNYYPKSTSKEILYILSMDALLLSKTNSKASLDVYKNIIKKGENKANWLEVGYFGLAKNYFKTYKKNKQKSFLEKAVQSIDSAFLYANNQLIFLQSEADKLNFKKNNSNLRALGLDILHTYYLKDSTATNTQNLILKFSENAKQNALKQSIWLTNLSKVKGIDTTLFQQEKIIKSYLKSYQNYLQNTNSTTSKKLFQQKIDSLNNAYTNLLIKISETANLYYDYFLNTNPLTVKELRSVLPKNSAYLLYATEKENGYIIGIDAEQFTVKKIPVKNLKKTIEKLNTYAQQNNFQEFKQIAVLLYNKLLLPVEAFFKNKKIYVSLDSSVYNLNLEIAIKNNYGANFGSLSYAIKNWNFNYLVSTESFYLKNKNSIVNSTTSYSIFSQQNYRHSNFTRQPFIFAALKDVAAKTSAKFYSNNKATKASFLTEMNSQNNLILGTHTILDNKNPMYSKLLFSSDKDKDESLFNYEILNQNNSPNFVALLSCSSTKGKNNTNFGLLSLANSFLYAGSNSVLCTLWDVDEKITASLAQKIFTQKKSTTVNKILRNTKLNYLENVNPNSRLASPYYWGGLINYGEHVLELKTPSKGLVLLLFFGLLVFSFAVVCCFKTTH